MMNYLVANGVCCCLELCCKQLKSGTQKVLGKQRFIKLIYCFIHLIIVSGCIMALFLFKDWVFFMKYIAPGIKCLQDSEIDCIGASTIYRVTLSLAIFQIIMMVTFIICSRKASLILNQNFYVSKMVIIIIIFILTMQIPNHYFMDYGIISQIISYFFIVYQVIILIDLAYLWGIKWAKNYSSGSTRYGCFLIFFSVAFESLAIYLNIQSYFIASNNQLCYQWTNYLCSGCLFLVLAVQLFNFNSQNSLLTTSLISLGIAYWSLTAITSQPLCYAIEHQTLYIQYGIGVFLLILTTIGSIFGSTINQQPEQSDFIQLKEEISQKPQNKLPKQQIQLLVRKQSKKWLKWHTYMYFASIYLGMLLTDWGSSNIVQGTFNETESAFYSKIFIVSLSTVVYVWTLIAPKLLPDRNFAFE